MNAQDDHLGMKNTTMLENHMQKIISKIHPEVQEIKSLVQPNQAQFKE